MYTCTLEYLSYLMHSRVQVYINSSTYQYTVCFRIISVCFLSLSPSLCPTFPPTHLYPSILLLPSFPLSRTQGAHFMSNAMYSARDVIIPSGPAYDMPTTTSSNMDPQGTWVWDQWGIWV